MAKNEDYSLDKDKRYLLYHEYLETIVDHRPPVFVMENVKGMLFARVNGRLLMDRVIEDLSNPGKTGGRCTSDLTYRLYSLSQTSDKGAHQDAVAYLVRTEDYGVPQARHRIFILGVRSDLYVRPSCLNNHLQISPTVENVIGNMPKIRSGVSRVKDSLELWKHAIASADCSSWFPKNRWGSPEIKADIQATLKSIERSEFNISSKAYNPPGVLQKLYYDPRLKGTISHESRSHMESDLHRYLFAASYASIYGVSPKYSYLITKMRGKPAQGTCFQIVFEYS